MTRTGRTEVRFIVDASLRLVAGPHEAKTNDVEAPGLEEVSVEFGEGELRIKRIDFG
jgi:hypothetical protein